MFNDLDPMLLLIPFIAFLLLLLAYSWMNNNNNMKEEKEPGRDPEELAPAWLMIILHGLSELHAKLALEVGKNSKNIKTHFIDIANILNISNIPKRCTCSTPGLATWRRSWTTCQ